VRIPKRGIPAHKLFRDRARKPAEIQANGGAVRGEVLGAFRTAATLPAETVTFHGKESRDPEEHPAVEATLFNIDQHVVAQRIERHNPLS
jgi:hypothetical protein